MPNQIIIAVVMLLVFAGLGFAMSLSIRKHDKKMAVVKKKKGRSKYLQQTRTPGK
jgi:hypothetical protein